MKRTFKYLLFGFLIFSLSFKNCYAIDVVCHEPDVLKAMRIVGAIVMIAKILVPLIIILTGIISMARAILFEDETAIRKTIDTLITKVFVGAIIFFIPSIVNAVLSLTSAYDNTKTKFSDCGKCMVSVKECEKLINKYK